MAQRHDHSPTLLVFTLGARRESRRRKLLPPALEAIEDRLHQACLDATLAAGRAAGCRLEVSSPLELVLPADVRRRRQRGAGFGSRLERALGETLAERRGAVVLVGSDVPDLDEAHLRRTLTLLEEDPERVVIGPSPDGGFYLLATARPLGEALSRVRWRCRETLRSLKRALGREGREIVLLPPLRDLDRRADLERWLAGSRRSGTGAADTPWRRLIVQLARALAELRGARDAEVCPAPRRRAFRAASLRGPPRLAAA